MKKLAVSLLLGAFGRAAVTATAEVPVCIDASLDRVEILDMHEDEHGVKTYEGLAVLTLPEYPAINVPSALAEGIPEGAPVNVCVYTSGAELRVYLTRDVVREAENRRIIREIRERGDK